MLVIHLKTFQNIEFLNVTNLKCFTISQKKVFLPNIWHVSIVWQSFTILEVRNMEISMETLMLVNVGE